MLCGMLPWCRDRSNARKVKNVPILPWCRDRSNARKVENGPMLSRCLDRYRALEVEAVPMSDPILRLENRFCRGVGIRHVGLVEFLSNYSHGIRHRGDIKNCDRPNFGAIYQCWLGCKGQINKQFHFSLWNFIFYSIFLKVGTKSMGGGRGCLWVVFDDWAQ